MNYERGFRAHLHTEGVSCINESPFLRANITTSSDEVDECRRREGYGPVCGMISTSFYRIAKKMSHARELSQTVSLRAASFRQRRAGKLACQN